VQPALLEKPPTTASDEYQHSQKANIFSGVAFGFNDLYL